MAAMYEEFCKPSEQMAHIGRHMWSVSRLFELSKSLQVMDVPLKHIHMYYTYEKLTLRQLVGHMRASLDADLDCPIILDEDGEIMDGRHRLMKAILNGCTTIKAVRFDKNPDPCRVEN